MIEIKGLYKNYDTRTERIAAISDLDLRLQEGERFGLFGPSGCGKSTFLRCLAGLETPDDGRVTIAGVTVFDASTGINLPPWKRPVGIVFQDLALWPHMKVLDNVMFPLLHGAGSRRKSPDHLERAREMLRAVRLEGLEERYPSELSGGQRQRVALARALAPSPRVLLLDEPFSSLDAHLRKQTRNELVTVLEETKITTIFVSHDHVDGLFMADRLGVMHLGRMVQEGTAQDVYGRPADATVAEAFDIGTIVSGSRQGELGQEASSYFIGDSGQTLALNVPLEDSVGDDPCSLLVRTRACRLWKADVDGGRVQKLLGVVVQQNFAGDGWRLLVRVAESLLEVWEDEFPGVRNGQEIAIAVDVERIQRIARGRTLCRQ